MKPIDDSKTKFRIKVHDCGYGRWAFGTNISYEKFHPAPSELYLNIYLGKYHIVIGKIYV